MELFEQVLKEMPFEFSTTLFIRKLRERNVSQRVIDSQTHLRFLKSKCDKITRNTFARRSEKSQLIFETSQINELTEETCIKFLKSKGYKIYKPITEFKEL